MSHCIYTRFLDKLCRFYYFSTIIDFWFSVRLTLTLQKFYLHKKMFIRTDSSLFIHHMQLKTTPTSIHLLREFGFKHMQTELVIYWLCVCVWLYVQWHRNHSICYSLNLVSYPKISKVLLITIMLTCKIFRMKGFFCIGIQSVLSCGECNVLFLLIVQKRILFCLNVKSCALAKWNFFPKKIVMFVFDLSNIKIYVQIFNKGIICVFKEKLNCISHFCRSNPIQTVKFHLEWNFDIKSNFVFQYGRFNISKEN